MRPRHRSSPDRRPSPSRRSRMSNPQMSPQSHYSSHHHSPRHHHHRMHPDEVDHPHHPHHHGGGQPPPQEEDSPTPICRCRVLYLGSAVPHVTKDGLQGIQEPLKELYPEDGALGAKGIDSWLSVWSNGFLLENVDENRKKVTRFFPVESLHYCAAVRYVLVPGTSSAADIVQRFLPLDSPFARNPNINHPPLFAAILRRTTGIKVLECHVFICKRETAANALVRCAFHAYADSTYAKRLESGGAGAQSLYGTIGAPTPIPMSTPTPNGGPAHANGAAGGAGAGSADNSREYQQSVIEVSEDSINSIEKVEEWKVLANGNSSSSPISGGGQAVGGGAKSRVIPNGGSTPSPRQQNGNGGGSPDEISVVNGDDNHKVWPGKTPEPPAEGLYDYGSTMRSFRSSASGLSHRNRPRQMMMPSSPPPPPIPEELQSTKEEGGKKEKKKKKRSKSREHSSHNMSAVDGMHHHHPMMMQNGDVPRGNGGEFRGSNSVINGPTSRGRQQSVNSLLPPPHMRPMNGHGPPRGGGGGGGPMPPMGPLPPPHMMMPPMNGKKAGTFSARGKKGRGMPHPFMMFPPQHYPPPHLMPPPGHPLYNGVMPPPPPQGPPSRGPGFAAEEPIYMPHNARPLSPVASYQPGHFPHEAYYSQQQYATIDKANKYRKNKPGSTKNGGKTSGSSKQPSSDSNADNDSEFGAGIYKKGHINERAFSYSIRNEHRSRSFGSLANMQFGPNGEAIMPQSGPVSPHHQNGNGIEQQQHSGENGGPVPNGKAGGGPPPRDYLNMMTDLDLADESIERSEVPPGLYQPGMGHHHPGMMPPPHMMMHGGGPPGPHMDPRHHQAMMAAAAHAHAQHQQQQQPQGKKKR